MKGLIERTVWTLLRRIRESLVERRRRQQARREPDLDAYVDDLEAAGATVVGTRDDESGPRIHVEFAGQWVDLEQRVELEYRLLDEMSSAGKTAIAIRPGPG